MERQIMTFQIVRLLCRTFSQSSNQYPMRQRRETASNKAENYVDVKNACENWRSVEVNNKALEEADRHELWIMDESFVGERTRSKMEKGWTIDLLSCSVNVPWISRKKGETACRTRKRSKTRVNLQLCADICDRFGFGWAQSFDTMSGGLTR